MENFCLDILNQINDAIWTYILIALLLGAAIYFTIRSKGVQFRMFGEMCRLLVESGNRNKVSQKDVTNDKDYGKSDTGSPARGKICPENSRTRKVGPSHHKISSFQAFAVSIASRVGTGNLAGVATAIAIGGPGAVFWMWIVALLGSANAFVESTLAQLFKIRGPKSFIGGPAYYILKGLHKKWWAVTFAVLITLTFGFAFNSVQSNTIAASLSSFGIPSWSVGIFLSALTIVIIWGGIQRISKVSEIVVPVMAIVYVILALTVVSVNWRNIPGMFSLIFSCAFSPDSAIGGGIGMAMIMGVKRGLFSNEAGEGSTPNAAATASVSHPVKQGLVQTLGVFTDTLLICTCTAFIILSSGLFSTGTSGIELTQLALDSEVGAGRGTVFIAIAVFFFAFTSVIANYYYGEANIYFILGRKNGTKTSRNVINLYRLAVTGMVMLGAVISLDIVWALADLTMALMTICNMAAILPLGKYALWLLKDYQSQKRAGKNPVYRSSAIPSIAPETECWAD